MKNRPHKTTIRDALKYPYIIYGDEFDSTTIFEFNLLFGDKQEHNVDSVLIVKDIVLVRGSDPL